MPAPRSAASSLVVPIAADAAALLLLVAVLVQAFLTTVVAAVPLAALDVVVALPAAIGSAVVLTRRARGRRARRLVGTGTALLALAAVPIGFTLMLLVGDLGAQHGPNPAGHAADRLGAVVTQDGGSRVCGRGDPGLGPDNVQPWYDAVYSSPSDDRLQQRLEERARRLGWQVVPNADTNPTSVPQVRIDTGLMEVGDACGTSGRVVTAPDGRRLVHIVVAYPARAR